MSRGDRAEREPEAKWSGPAAWQGSSRPPDGALLRAVVDACDAAVVATTPDGAITFWSEPACRLFGYSVEEVADRSISLLIPAERRAEEQAVLERVVRGEAVQTFETVRIAKSGAQRRVSLAMRPIREGSAVVGVLHVAQERSAGATELRTIIDSVPVLISYIDRDMRYRLNNSAYERWFGRSRGEMEGRRVEDVLGAAAWQKVGGHLREAASGRVVAYEDEIPYAHGPRWVRATYTPHLAPDGTTLGVVVLVADVAERKRAEEALAEASRRKDEFLATLAHELRNPLAALRTALQIVRTHPDPREHAHACDVMERQLGQLVRLVDDLVDVARITRGSIDLRRERVELRRVTRSALETSLPWIEQRQQQIRVQLPEEPIFLDADPVRLAQVLANLLSNAAAFSEPGGHITLSAERSGHDVEIVVADTGIGLRQEELTRIFDVFTQSSPPSDRSSGGLGVGLWIVQRLVELHGGRVEARSAGVGRGSQFSVRLPLAGADARSPVVAHEAPVAIPTRSARILVIDDNADAGESLATLLRLDGHDVHVAHDGVAGLELASRLRPEIVLLDIGLPGRDGYQVAREIRSRPWGCTALLIAVTGWGEARDKQLAREAGFDLHLTKPVDLEALARIVSERVRTEPPGVGV